MIEKASMLTAREHLASALLDGKLYVIGGKTAGIAANIEANEIYDPITDKWSILEPMPSKRGDWLSVLLNETIHLFDGRTRWYISQ